MKGSRQVKQPNKTSLFVVACVVGIISYAMVYNLSNFMIATPTTRWLLKINEENSMRYDTYYNPNRVTNYPRMLIDHSEYY